MSFRLGIPCLPLNADKYSFCSTHSTKSNATATNESSAVASFNWHSQPITSLEWHPTEDSCFAVCSEDDTVTLWDLAVELDEDEAPQKTKFETSKTLPPQLLFIHQGQKELKELHWHESIPGCLITTGQTGFSVFKTISI